MTNPVDDLVSALKDSGDPFRREVLQGAKTVIFARRTIDFCAFLVPSALIALEYPIVPTIAITIVSWGILRFFVRQILSGFLGRRARIRYEARTKRLSGG